MTIQIATVIPPISQTPWGEYRVANMLTRREFQEIERIKSSEYFLVRNDGAEIGERGVCRWHIANPMTGVRDPAEKPIFHDHFTLMCVERPFAGLEGGLRAWIQVAGESERKQQIIDGFGIGIRDYAEMHPFTARALQPSQPDALAWYSVLIGVAEPITEDQARRYAEKIRDRRPPKFPSELLPLLRPKLKRIK